MTAIPIVVPDSSVLLKWVIDSKDEQDRDRALRIREMWLSGQCSIVLPSLWFFEVGNILGMKQPALAAPIMKILVDYRFDEERPAGIYQKSFELMNAYKVTFYDAAYHALAITRSGTMVTADDTYYRKASPSGHIQHLSSFAIA